MDPLSGGHISIQKWYLYDYGFRWTIDDLHKENCDLLDLNVMRRDCAMAWLITKTLKGLQSKNIKIGKFVDSNSCREQTEVSQQLQSGKIRTVK